MRSMTGYGRSVDTETGRNITIEIKTVNNRFLDVNLRMPSELSRFENDLKKIVSGRLNRGRVDISIQYDKAESTELEVDRSVVSALLNAMREMKTEYDLAGEPDINVIARLPNVFVSKRAELDDSFYRSVASVLSSALDELESMRDKEGSLLETELLARLGDIDSRIPTIRDAAESVVDEYRTKLYKRIEDILAKTSSQIEVDQGRLAQEIAYIAERADISEELARLAAHIEHFKSIMNESNDVGKRLDFLTQELNREANTIASKTNSIDIKEHALAIKNEIEKIREQVQNVE